MGLRLARNCHEEARLAVATCSGEDPEHIVCFPPVRYHEPPVAATFPVMLHVHCANLITGGAEPIYYESGALLEVAVGSESVQRIRGQWHRGRKSWVWPKPIQLEVWPT